MEPGAEEEALATPYLAIIWYCNNIDPLKILMLICASHIVGCHSIKNEARVEDHLTVILTEP